jgi:hypothetical protein
LVLNTRALRLASCETTTESKAAFGEYQQLKDWAEHGRPIDLDPDPWTERYPHKLYVNLTYKPTIPAKPKDLRYSGLDLVMATITLSKYTEVIMDVLKLDSSLVTGRINSQFLSAIRGNLYSFVCRLLEQNLARYKGPLPKIWLDEMEERAKRTS